MHISQLKPPIMTFVLRISALLLIVPVLWMVSRRPVGGEIYMPDFENGVKIYVEEGYFWKFLGPSQPPETEPHSIWLVTDTALGEEILDLCQKIEQYRQFEKSSDIALGFADSFEYLPRIYLAAERVCYSIEIINWENYSDSAWSKFPIRLERFGQPTMHIFGTDTSLMPEDETPYGYLRENLQSDTLNSESGLGWYSSIPQESMDKLLGLLESIGPENAVRAEEIG